MRFLGKVLKKVDQIRTDLGSLADLFDAAFQRYFRQKCAEDVVQADLLDAIEKKRKKTKRDLPAMPVSGKENEEAHTWLRRELDFYPDQLQKLLEVALGTRGGAGFAFSGPDSRGRYRFPSVPDSWRGVVDSEVRLGSDRNDVGALPAIIFDGARNIVDPVRPAVSTAPANGHPSCMHLGRPLVRQALLYLSRARFPGTDEARSASRWIVRSGPVPPACDALVLITVEELAVNNLRETFLQWVRTLRFPVKSGKLGAALPHVPRGRGIAQGVVEAPDQQDPRSRHLGRCGRRGQRRPPPPCRASGSYDPRTPRPRPPRGEPVPARSVQGAPPGDRQATRPRSQRL